MKNYKICLFLVLVFLFGVCATSEASITQLEDPSTIYLSSFATSHQHVESNTQFTHTFMNVPASGFNNLDGTFAFTWSRAPSQGGSRGAPSASFDVYVGDPDTAFEDWFQLADDVTKPSGRISLELTNEVLESILSDGNGNISFVVIPNDSDIFVNSGKLRVNGAPVPLPGAAWLLGSGLLALIGFRRRLQG